MTRAGLYGRYSSDNQRRTSTEDQLRNARAIATRESLEVVGEYADDETSGSVPMERREAGARLMRDANAGVFDVIIIEALDRFSRDLVDQERMVRRLEHHGIRIISYTDGYDTRHEGREFMRQIRGSVNEERLREIGKKTHRGLDGQVVRGFHAGGISYGYDTSVVGYDAKGEPIGHRLLVNETEAEQVRWIFERYAEGWSCQKIAFDLNRRSVPSPRGGTWAVSALYGSPDKGSGILNNELYIGRYVWNRSRWVKDPDTNRRTRVSRPASEWKVIARADLAIVPPEYWAAVRARMARPTRTGGSRGKGSQPRTLFGGLVVCGHCGGAVVAVNRTEYGCAARKDRGPTVCPGVRVSRLQLESRLLALLRDDLLSPAAIAAVQADVSTIVAEARRERDRTQARAGARRAELEREIENLVDAVARTGLSGALQARLGIAEAERAKLGAERPEATVAAVQGVQSAYRRLVADLQGSLTADVPRARELLQGAIGEIRLLPEGNEIYAEIESRPGLLAMAGGEILGMVAGTRFGTRKRIRIR